MLCLRSLDRAARATAASTVETSLHIRRSDSWRQHPSATGGHRALGLAARAAPADDDDGARAGVEDGLVDGVRGQEEDRLEGVDVAR